MVSEQEQATIDAVTLKLVRPLDVGDIVAVLWETKDFKRCNLYKIEKGWYYFKNLNTGREGACPVDRLKRYGD